MNEFLWTYEFVIAVDLFHVNASARVSFAMRKKAKKSQKKSASAPS